MKRLDLLLKTMPVLCMCLLPHFSFSQQAVAACGEQIKGAGGALSFTLGQVAFTQVAGVSHQLNEGVQQVFTLKTTPVEELVLLKEVQVFPNPTVDLLTLTLPIADQASIPYQLMDASGKVARAGVLPTGTASLSLDLLAPGSYYLVLHAGNENRAFSIIKR